MGRVIGAASEFYRLRVTRLDESHEPDLEWRDDILYREAPRDVPEEYEAYALEAVTLNEAETTRRIALYEDADSAAAALESVAEDLAELTKSAFDARYLTEG